MAWEDNILLLRSQVVTPAHFQEAKLNPRVLYRAKAEAQTFQLLYYFGVTWTLY